MENPKNTVVISEEMVIEILARLPLRSIARFKLVARNWKSILESLYFRRLFLSLKRSRSWSLGSRDLGFLMDFHRCQTWDFLNSLAYYIWNIIADHLYFTFYKDSSNGLVLLDGDNGRIYVGNPILQQWVVIPYPDILPISAHLATRVDEDGVVLSFKVIMFDETETTRSNDRSSICLLFYIYSSETGIWTRKQLHCPRYFFNIQPLMTLHGMLYLGDNSDVIVAHDFYGESNVCRMIPLPDHNDQFLGRKVTKSTEFVMYVKILANNVIKVWRLLNSDDDDSAWELMWKTRLMFDNDISSYQPFTMHPLDCTIVYLWNFEYSYLVSCNLKTQKYHIFTRGHMDGLLNHSNCEKHMDGLCTLYLHGKPYTPYNSFQYVTPRWMGSVPCPPEAEILDEDSVIQDLEDHFVEY